MLNYLYKDRREKEQVHQNPTHARFLGRVFKQSKPLIDPLMADEAMRFLEAVLKLPLMPEEPRPYAYNTWQKHWVAFARSGLLMSIAVTVGIQIVVQFGAEGLVSLFGESSQELTQAAVLYLRITCSVNGIFYASMYALDSFVLASGAPRLALANSLIDAFVMRMGLAWLLSVPLSCGFLGIYAAQAAAPVLPAIIGFAYLRLWARRNLPEQRLP